MENHDMSGSEQKVQEYIKRLRDGESKNSIMQGLPTSFKTAIEAGLGNVEGKKATTIEREDDLGIPPQYKGLDPDVLDFIWTVPEYIDPEKTKIEKDKRQTAIDTLRRMSPDKIDKRKTEVRDEIRAGQIRIDLGIGSEEDIADKERELEKLERRSDYRLIEGLIKYVSTGRKQAVIDLYDTLFKDIDNVDSKKKLIAGLIQDIYNKYRTASYPIDPKEAQTWENALQKHKVDINNRNSEWMYRGVFPKNSESTITRGSFNVNVTPELIDKLDDLIASGRIKANYKFGQPGTSASPTERHDSISIYFLEYPSEEILKELATIIRPYVRGDNLLGRKVDEGFFMSEIGSIQTEHIESFIKRLESKDIAFAEAVKSYSSPRPGGGTSLKMSEAQYYAVRDVARAFGYQIAYDKDKGFKIN